MKFLTALVTSVALLGFGAAAFACTGMEASKRQQVADQSDAPYLPPPAQS
jgi:hypothetical protein